MTRTAFVTGANGFVGLNLVRELLAQEWRVVAMCRRNADTRDLDPWPVERVFGDVTQLDSLREAMPKSPDAVFHVAGNTSLWARSGAEQLKVNVRGTRNVVRVALERRARRFVHTSSVVAYGVHGGIVTEQTPTRGSNSQVTYIRSKAMAEREVKHGIQRGLPAVIINPGHVIGPYDRYNWSRLFGIVRGRRLPGVPAGGGSFCHAPNVAKALVAAAERGEVGANYLLGGADTSYVGLVQEVSRILGRKPRVLTLPNRLLHAYASAEEFIAPLFGREPEITRDTVHLMSCNMYCSSRKAMDELGYQPSPLASMLEHSHRWLLENRLLRS